MFKIEIQIKGEKGMVEKLYNFIVEFALLSCWETLLGAKFVGSVFYEEKEGESNEKQG